MKKILFLTIFMFLIFTTNCYALETYSNVNIKVKYDNDVDINDVPCVCVEIGDNVKDNFEVEFIPTESNSKNFNSIFVKGTINIESKVLDSDNYVTENEITGLDSNNVNVVVKVSKIKNDNDIVITKQTQTTTTQSTTKVEVENSSDKEETRKIASIFIKFLLLFLGFVIIIFAIYVAIKIKNANK